MMRILFCVNWKIAKTDAPEIKLTRFSPDYKISGEPYWFFRHLAHPPEVDVMDYSVPLGTQRMELAFTHCLWSQGLAAYLASRRYDVIISHGTQSGLILALLQTMFRTHPTPHVVFDINRITGLITDPRILRACRTATRSVTSVITHSTRHLDFYKEQFPRLASIAHFIPLGVDPVEFAPRRCIVEDQIICVGYAKRDWRLLVNAYSELRTKTKLVLLGIPRSERITEDGVHCVPRVSIEEMRQWISRSRFVVLPLPWHEYCIGQQTFLQTMAMGKTALVADIPAALDYIQDGNNGFLYKTGNKEDLRRKLQRLLDSPEVVEQTGLNARDRIERDFSEATMAERILDVLQRAVASNSHAFA